MDDFQLTTRDIYRVMGKFLTGVAVVVDLETKAAMGARRALDHVKNLHTVVGKKGSERPAKTRRELVVAIQNAQSETLERLSRNFQVEAHNHEALSFVEQIEAIGHVKWVFDFTLVEAQRSAKSVAAQYAEVSQLMWG